MMRSDMPKQVMAYRNGGGIPSLATAPMNANIGGEPHQLSYITPFEAELLRGMGGSGTPGPGGVPQYAGVYETIFGKPFSDTAVGQALGMEHSTGPLPASASAVDTSSAAGVAAASGPTSKAYGYKGITTNNASGARGGDDSSSPNTAANTAATTTNTDLAASTAALEAAKADLAAFQGSDLAQDASIINMVNNRDDLTILEKIEFAEQLAGDFGLTDSKGVAPQKHLLKTLH